MTGEIEKSSWEDQAAVLYVRYAGFIAAEDLTAEEKLVSLVSLVPMSLNVVDEARDTIYRLNEENERLREELNAARATDP
jgi:hypothetical protein